MRVQRVPPMTQLLVRVLATALLPFFLSAGAAAAKRPAVVVSLSPIHSIIAGVMDGAGEPVLLVKSGASPHVHALKPADAKALNDADLIVWVGPKLESFLVKPIASLGGGARVETLIEAEGLTLHPLRAGGPFEANDDDRHESDADDQHGQQDIDGHIWLSPDNAKRIAEIAYRALIAIDPARANLYRRNLQSVKDRIDALDRELAGRLAPARAVPFVVYHDAFQYFERHYGLSAAGSITLSPDRQAGVRRIAAIRRKLGELDVACLFTEPQFEPALIESIAGDTGVRVGRLDPLGVGAAPGKQAYFEMMRALAEGFRACLVAGG